MPAYDYRCDEHGEFEQFFKSLPSEAKQRSMPCPDCDKPSVRLLANFSVNGTQHSGMEDAASFATRPANIGGRHRPVFTDNNGKVHEIKTSSDIDRWRRDNRLGTPRMVEWTNTVTGQKSFVPQRVKMVAGSDGEPIDCPVLKESAKIVPLDNYYEPPKESRTGVPFDKRGVSVLKGKDAYLPSIDPTTGKKMKMSEMWGAGSGAENIERPISQSIKNAMMPTKVKRG